jgi:tetratricopeptide (TPR) repeat protein
MHFTLHKVFNHRRCCLARRLSERLALLAMGLSLGFTPVLQLQAAELSPAEQAQAAYQAHAYSQALSLYLQLLAATPNSAELHYQVGTSALLSGDAILARSHLQKSLELKPDNLSALNHLGLAYIALEEAPAAIALYNQVLKQRPFARELWVNLGKLYRRQNQLEPAREAWQRAQALKFDPGLDASLQALPAATWPAFTPAAALVAYRQAVAREEQGNTSAALKAYSQLLSQYPDCAAAAFRRARFWLAQKNRAAALADLNTVIAQEPGHLAAHFERARLSISAKNLAAAEADLYTVLGLNPAYEPARELLLQLLVAQADKTHKARAKQLLFDWLQVRPEDQASRKRLVAWELQAQNLAQAWALLQPLAESEEADSLHLLGKLAWLNHDAEQAETYFSQAFAQAPPPLEAQPEAAQWLISQGRNNEALVFMTDYLKHHPQDLPLLILGGSLALQQNQAGLAVAWLEAAQKLSPHKPEIDKYLGLAWLKQGQRAKARTALGVYLQKNPQAADARDLRQLLQVLKTP